MATKKTTGRVSGKSVLKGISVTTTAVAAQKERPAMLSRDFEFPNIKIVEVDTNRKYYCTCCGKEYDKPVGNFISSRSPLYRGNGGYVPICKRCIEVYFDAMVEFFDGDEDHAMVRMCQLFDWYYCEDAMKDAEKQARAHHSKIFLYPSKANSKYILKRGVTYLDTIRERSEDWHTIKTADDLARISQSQEKASYNENDEDEQFVVTKAIVRKWGMGYTPEQYEFLEQQFDDWKLEVSCKTKPERELVQLLCIAQLNIRRAQNSGDETKANSALKAFQDLLGSANLKPNQQNDTTVADQNSFGTLIQIWENEEPIPEPDPEWRDVDGIRKKISTFFYGHLAKALHIKNDNAREYEEEMAKYTVSKPSNAIQEEVDPTSIFGGGGESDD